MHNQMVGIQGELAQAVTAKPQSSKSHLLYIDNLRTVLITLVILLHVAVTYGAVGDWYYYEAGETSTVAFVIMTFAGAIGTAFVLGLFFTLAGYFTPGEYLLRNC